jgi:hypothetical protein
MADLISISPTVLVNPDNVSAVEMIDVGGVPTLAVYVDGRVFTATERIEEILGKLKTDSPLTSQFWAGR